MSRVGSLSLRLWVMGVSMAAPSGADIRLRKPYVGSPGSSIEWRTEKGGRGRAALRRGPARAGNTGMKASGPLRRSSGPADRRGRARRRGAREGRAPDGGARDGLRRAGARLRRTHDPLVEHVADAHLAGPVIHPEDAALAFVAGGGEARPARGLPPGRLPRAGTERR